MKKLLIVASLGLLLAGCEDITIDTGRHPTRQRTSCPSGQFPDGRCPDGKCPDWRNAGQEVPAMDIPKELREHNWGGGSCVHASTVMCFRWQQQYDMADYWRKTYSGGESLGGLVSKMEKNDITYAYTGSGDPAFLDWCTRTRRGAVIFYFSSHSICFVGHHGDQAWLLDNNREDHFLQVPWSEFVPKWKGFGGFALSPLYVPIPPNPVATPSL